jgi:hypothetical protein
MRHHARLVREFSKRSILKLSPLPAAKPRRSPAQK